MNKKLVISLFLITLYSNPVLAIDMNGIRPVNPLDNNPTTYQEVISQPAYDLKRGSLTKILSKINIRLQWINLCRVMCALLIRILKC